MNPLASVWRVTVKVVKAKIFYNTDFFPFFNLLHVYSQIMRHTLVRNANKFGNHGLLFRDKAYEKYSDFSEIGSPNWT